MSDYTLVGYALQLGAVVRSCVDLGTGEMLSVASGHVARTPAGDEDGAQKLPGCEGGLSNPQICTREGQVSYWIGGSLITCKKPMPESKQVGGGPRKSITGFSARSRLNLLYTIGKIQKSVTPYLITLTYPLEWSQDARKWKNDLRKFYQRMRRKVGRVCALWKLEPQKRGAPHFHLLVWGLGGVPLEDLRLWISRIWYEVVNSADVKHLQAGTRVEKIRDWKGVMSYASKYLGKVIEAVGWDKPGRFWGVLGREFIPWAELIQAAISFPEAVKLLRLLRRKIHCKRSNLPALSILTGSPDYWFTNHERLVA